MKTILVDAIHAFVIKGEGIFNEMQELLEEYPNRKVILTNADDDEMLNFGLNKMPYEVFTLKHNPEAVDSAKSVGIKTYFYDKEKRDLSSLEQFLKENLK